MTDRPTVTGRQRLALVAVSLATFMTYLDNNIVNVAIPDIERDLQLDTAGLEWVVSAYILTFSALMLMGGRLADLLGRRRMLLGGLVVFGASSLVAGLAGSAEILIAARAVQGVGAAMITPTTLAIISATFTDTRARNAAVAVWGSVGAVSVALGPLLGGVFSQYMSWGWIFFVNIPVGIVTVVLTLVAVDESRAPTSDGLDIAGLSLSVVGLTALTFALIEGHELGWTAWPIVVSFAIAAGAVALFVQVERRSSAPMVDLGLFRSRAFTGGLIALMLFAFGLFGIYFFTSLYVQGVLGFSPTKAGVAFLPMALCMVVGAALSDRMAERFGAHHTVSAALVLMGAGIASVFLLGANTGFAGLMPSFVIIGIGGGLTISLTATVLSHMPTEQAGVGSGVFNASREVAALLGITVLGAILTARQQASLRVGNLAPEAFLDGFHLAVLVAGLLVAAGGVVAWYALRPTRVEDTAAAVPAVASVAIS
ncbi:MFS transporter [Streptomyces sp. SID6673]|nr:MFS transporter [Streptomyces sp. SID11726]NEB26935.1 MFS transporter [Streptomyces sp. SID6673]